ncbi:hypothetical protein EF847_22585 [Actinobacteria bacterium YIM 96077]|uniref:Uncharacterized protein n=1 Tax=Phytoactinopolyspora halophila TaxID=1981511 RepID=A0A329QR65_9ACTN|nr:hypothetical protein EF847_22585 [Actinobacteria bacterium YIM 96077]RAW14169.1 hypothetical protein DPM12_10935 [Phytoactinopolyspora halophila]
MTSSTTNRRVLSTSPFQSAAPEPIEPFEVNDLLTHDRHGMGRVVAVGPDNKIHVDFGGGARTITLPNPKVTRL